MIGIDIIEVSRIKEAISDTDGFLQKIFTEKEIAYCQSRSSKFQSFAARFAGKEAFMKALSTGWAQGISFKDIEILNAENGKPYIVLHAIANELLTKNGFTKAEISMSHTESLATAIVMLTSNS